MSGLLMHTAVPSCSCTPVHGADCLQLGDSRVQRGLLLRVAAAGACHRLLLQLLEDTQRGGRDVSRCKREHVAASPALRGLAACRLNCLYPRLQSTA